MQWLDDNDPEVQAERERYRKAHPGNDAATLLEVADARPPEYSDEALALRFSEKHGTEARYVAMWGRWLHWTGQRWEFDLTMRTFDFARSICRIASAEAEVKLAAAIASAKTVAAVVTLARADRRHAAIVDQWDADPWLLNTRGDNAD